MLETIGKYEIREEIGRGAMGAVYEGFDTMIGRRVAIKTLRTEMFEPRQLPQVRERFKREAQSAGRLAHPHIVTIFDYGEHQGTPYIVMEYIAGRELGSELKRGVRYALDDVVRLMTQLLGALAHAHENGVVHRDVKPANMFVLDDGSLKVVDFGIARVEESDLTDTGAMMGTPAYMSPEQFLGLTAEARSDIYSAGVVLYQLLTGDKPFTGSVTTIMQKVLRQNPLPPSELNPTLSTVWDTVVARAMAKKPEARYESARQFAEAIKLAHKAERRYQPDLTVAVELRNRRPEVGNNARTEATNRDAEERARLATEETVPAEAEDRVRAEAGENARREADRKSEEARLEAEERARLAAEETVPAEPQERARAEAAEIARREAERKAEEARLEAEARARAIALEKAKAEAEERARTEAEEIARREAERKAEEARLEAENRARAAALEKARVEAEERARAEAKEIARREAERKAEEARLEAENRARAAALEKARVEAEERARAEAEEIARREAERKAEEARLEAENRARAAALEKARVEAEERTRAEAAENARREAERKAEEARLEAENRARAAALEKARVEAEERTRAEAAENARREAERKAEEARLEAEARVRATALEKAKAEAALKAAHEAQERARAGAAENARREAERKAEEARRKAEQLARAQAEERVFQDTELGARQQAKEKSQTNTNAAHRMPAPHPEADGGKRRASWAVGAFIAVAALAIGGVLLNSQWNESTAKAEKARRETELAAAARTSAADLTRKDAEARAKKEAEEQALAEATALAHARAKKEIADKAEAERIAAEKKGKAETAALAAAEAQAKKNAEEKARVEALARKEAEDKAAAAKMAAQAAALAAAEARTKKEAEEKARVEALARKEAEEKAAAAKKAEEARQAAQKPGAVFSDCADCPRMVVIPAGEFMMGTPASETERDADEGPVHRVTIANAYALGRNEVTVAEFRRFVEDAGYKTEAERNVRTQGCFAWDQSDKKFDWRAGRSWSSPGYDQTDRQPVVCVSWNDARAYVQWLSRKTGKRYRLPSEAEWEYAARAGTSTARYWGDDPDQACRYANVADQTTYQGSSWSTKHNCNDGHWFPAPAGTYAANKFGLYDVLGNAWEWIEDCYNNSYAGAPSDGSAWLGGNCSVRVVRGGSWGDDPRFVRSGKRGGSSSGGRVDRVGFRLARTLE